MVIPKLASANFFVFKNLCCFFFSFPSAPIFTLVSATGLSDLLTARVFFLENNSQLGLQLSALWLVSPASSGRSGNPFSCWLTSQCNGAFSWSSLPLCCLLFIHLFPLLTLLFSDPVIPIYLVRCLIGICCLLWENELQTADGDLHFCCLKALVPRVSCSDPQVLAQFFSSICLFILYWREQAQWVVEI